VEEPHLREHDGSRSQPDCNRVPCGDDQRQQPDEVLRREDLGEGEKPGDRRAEGERQLSA